jgi:hypothetical protein
MLAVAAQAQLVGVSHRKIFTPTASPVTIIQTYNNFAHSGYLGTVNFSSTPVAGNTVVACGLNIQTTTAPTPVTLNSVAGTLISNTAHNNDWWAGCYKWENIAGGNGIRLFSDSCNGCYIFAWEIHKSSGYPTVDQAMSQNTTSYSSTFSSTATATLARTGELALGVVIDTLHDQTFTADGSWANTITTAYSDAGVGQQFAVSINSLGSSSGIAFSGTVGTSSGNCDDAFVVVLK